MKSKFVSAAVAILFATVTCQCVAQPEPPQRLLRKPGPPEAAAPSLQQVTTFTGTVNEWINNDDYVYDGFYLQTTAGKLLVKFAPHMGAQIVKAIKTGNTVSVNGTSSVNPEGIREIHMVTIMANGQTITDVPPAAPIAPEDAGAINGKGKITGLRLDKEGRVNGFVVDSKIILKTPPHIAAQLNALLTTGSDISFTGIKKQGNNGEAMADNYSIVHCQTITINGTQYLTN